jgi:N-acetylmuramoyl-L-alanine amidase
MQKALGGLVADGIFGSNTEKALKSFQKKCGLAQTGILDSITYNLLYDVSLEPKKPKVGIDPGHGLRTPGKRSANLLDDLYINGELVRRKGEFIREYEFNIATALKLKEALERCGFDTFVTETNGDDIGLSERRNRIREQECDFSVAIHYNAAGDGSSFNSGNGLSGKVDDDTPTQFSKDIVQDILIGIAEIKGQRIRGLDEANLAMTNDDALGCPSCLIECGFMTNLTEVKYMLDTDYQKAVAEAMTKALCKAYGMEYILPDTAIEPPVVEPPQEPPVNNTIDKERIIKHLQNVKKYCIEYIEEQIDSIIEAL